MGQINVIREEITVDPLALGYAAMSDIEVVNSMNALTRTRNVKILTGAQLGAAIDESEYKSLADADKVAVREMVSQTEIDPFGFSAIVIRDIFAVNSNTLTALAALRIDAISRATELGINVVKKGHVEMARAVL